MSLAVVVLSWNAAGPLRRCLQSLAALDPAPARLVVVDNASTDGSPAMVAADFPGTWLIRNPANLGFSGGMNVGIRALLAEPHPPEAIVLLNQDTVADAGWLGALAEALAADPGLGAVGCKIRYPDGSIQHAGVVLERPRAVVRHLGWHARDDGSFDQPAEPEFVTGAALALRSAALERAGLFDEGYAPAYYEDVDLLWRIRWAGFRVGYAPRATLIHQESLSISDELSRGALYNRGRLRFVLKSYPLAELTGPFAAAERAFIAEHGHNPEGRALRWAYSECLASLPGIVAARRALDPDLPDSAAEAMAGLLRDLRRHLAHSLFRRAEAAAAEIFSL